MNTSSQNQHSKSVFSYTKSIGGAALSTILYAYAAAQDVAAQIYNPAVGAGVGGDRVADAAAAGSGSIFTTYILRVIQFIISAGGIMVLLYFVWGAVEWITAGGDSSKIQKGRDKIVQAIIGMILLVGSFAIIGFINTLFFQGMFDLLRIEF